MPRLVEHCVTVISKAVALINPATTAPVENICWQNSTTVKVLVSVNQTFVRIISSQFETSYLGI